MVTSVGNDMEKLESPYIVGEIIKKYSHFGKQLSTNVNTELQYNPAIPLLGTYPR